MKKLIGTWVLNDHLCKLYGHPDWECGRGEGYFPTDTDPFAEVHVALAGDWETCVDTLLHETMELCMVLKDCAYKPLNQIRYDTDTRMFQMTHAQFTEIMALTGAFAAQAITGKRPLERAWCKANNRTIIR